MLHNFFAFSFIPYVGIAFFFIFLCSDSTLDKNIRRLFFILCTLEFCELTINNLELWTSSFSSPGFPRMFFSALGYSLRVTSIYILLLLGIRDITSLRVRIAWGIPAFINILVSFSVFFSDIAYTFSSDNHFQRGPLGYTPHIIFFFYLISISILAIKNTRKRTILETVTILMVGIFISSSILCSTFFEIDGLGPAATIYSTIFYYMFFQTQIYNKTIFEEQKSRMLFEKRAQTDDLTGLLNKNAFCQSVTNTIKENPSESMALIFLDLDHFKDINDSLGHLMGDSVIKDTGKKLQSVLRNSDTIGRFGGDEFCALLRNITYSSFTLRLDEILTSLRTSYSKNSETIFITASIGAVFCERADNVSLNTLFELSDQAVYKAKSDGRDRYIIRQYKKSP